MTFQSIQEVRADIAESRNPYRAVSVKNLSQMLHEQRGKGNQKKLTEQFTDDFSVKTANDNTEKNDASICNKINF